MSSLIRNNGPRGAQYGMKNVRLFDKSPLTHPNHHNISLARKHSPTASILMDPNLDATDPGFDSIDQFLPPHHSYPYQISSPVGGGSGSYKTHVGQGSGVGSHPSQTTNPTSTGSTTGQTSPQTQIGLAGLIPNYGKPSLGPGPLTGQASSIVQDICSATKSVWTNMNPTASSQHKFLIVRVRNSAGNIDDQIVHVDDPFGFSDAVYDWVKVGQPLTYTVEVLTGRQNAANPHPNPDPNRTYSVIIISKKASTASSSTMATVHAEAPKPIQPKVPRIFTEAEKEKLIIAAPIITDSFKERHIRNGLLDGAADLIIKRLNAIITLATLFQKQPLPTSDIDKAIYELGVAKGTNISQKLSSSIKMDGTPASYENMFTKLAVLKGAWDQLLRDDKIPESFSMLIEELIEGRLTTQRIEQFRDQVQTLANS